MSEEVSDNEHQCLSESQGSDSQDSMEFQELKAGQRDSIRQAAWSSLYRDRSETLLQQQQKTKNQRIRMQIKINELEKELKSQSQKLQIERKQKNKYLSLYQKLNLQQIKASEKPFEVSPEMAKLKAQNLELKELNESLKQQNQEFIDKINCLQKKLQLQKQENDSKFNQIKRNLQSTTKVPMKNIDNQNLIKFMVSKLNEMEKIVVKLGEIDEMIIEKPQKVKNLPENTDILQQKYNVLEKVQSFLIKQQAKINSLKSYSIGIEKELQEAKKGGNLISSGLNKLFNPVIKLCKTEEPKEVEIKKRKDNI